MDRPLRIIGLSALTSAVVATTVLAVGIRLYQRPSQAGTLPLVAQAVSPLNRMAQEEAPVIHAIEQSEPAVASVIISKDLPVLEQVYETVPFGMGGSIRIPRIRQRGTELQEVGGGTAFFVTHDGLMVTNNHVVSDPEAQYSVLLNDGRTLKAEVVARDHLTDIALLKVQGDSFTALSVSAENEPTLGQTVIAIGNALGEFRNTVSVGVISGLQRTITAGNPAQGTSERLNRIIQTDAAINQGNSGGPLLNLDGEVVGMSTAVAAGAQNIGFAIPASDIRRVVQSYTQHGRIVRPYLGVRYVPLTQERAQELNLSVHTGALIVSDTGEPAILPGSPAEKAGLREKDVIVSIDGEALSDTVMLGDIVQRRQPKDTLTLGIIRGAQERTLTVVLDEWRE